MKLVNKSNAKGTRWVTLFEIKMIMRSVLSCEIGKFVGQTDILIFGFRSSEIRSSIEHGSARVLSPIVYTNLEGLKGECLPNCFVKNRFSCNQILKGYFNAFHSNRVIFMVHFLKMAYFTIQLYLLLVSLH